MGTRLALVFASLALVAPAVAAQPLQGELWFDEPPTLEGDATFASDHGVLDLSAWVAQGAPLRLSWASAHGAMLGYHGQEIGGAQTDGGPTSAPLSWGSGELGNLTCGSSCRVYLVAAGEGSVGLHGTASASPALGTGLPRIELGTQGTDASARIDLAPLRLEETPERGAFAGSPRGIVASGNVTLLMWDAQGVARMGEQEETVWTGGRNTSLGASVLDVAGHNYELRLLNLTLVDVHVEAAPSGPAALTAPSFDVALSGSLASERADGWAQSGDKRVDVRAEPIEATGALQVFLAPAARGEGPAAQPPDALAERKRGDLGGDGVLRVGGGLVGGAGRAPEVAAVVVGSGLVALALLLALRGGVFAALYTRVTSGRVLESPVRVALYDLIRARPGTHVSELAREMRVGRVTLQHHLRMLEAHRIVTSRARGRELAYFIPGSVPGEEELSARLALKDGSRRRVMQAVQERGEGATQGEIVAATALSARLVSYHLARLEAAGLVRSDQARPQRYHPTVMPGTRPGPETTVSERGSMPKQMGLPP